MSGTAAAVLGFVVMLLLIGVRMPVGLSMLVTGAVGYVYLSGWGPFLAYMKTNPYYQFANYTLSVIPLFILMGAFAERSGLSTALFRAASVFIGHLRGGLAMAVIAACTAFGAICGSSVATTATFGRAALPELRRYRYDPGFATGTIAVGGTLGILIPPSVILVVYAITTEQNIAKLFMAAFVPGILAAIFYCIVDRPRGAAQPGARAAACEGERARQGRGDQAGVAGAPRRLRRRRRHLWRRVHADGGCGGRRHRDVPGRRRCRASSAGPRSRRAWSRPPRPRA